MPYQPRPTNLKKKPVNEQFNWSAFDQLSSPLEQSQSSPQMNQLPQVAAQPQQVTQMPIQMGASTGFSPSALSSRNAAIKYDEQGRPIRNDYLSITDEMGNLRDQFSMAKNIGPAIGLNTQGLEAYRQMAMTEGPSAWANLASQQQGMEEQNALQNAMRSNQQAQNQAFNNLAGRGGLSQGQRERLQLQALRQGIQNSQNIMNQGMQSRLNIGMQDQGNRANMLRDLQNMDLTNANFQQGQRSYMDQATQSDIGNALKDVGGFNAYQSDAFGKAMQEWGTGKTADAQAKAARSSGGKK